MAALDEGLRGQVRDRYARAALTVTEVGVNADCWWPHPQRNPALRRPRKPGHLTVGAPASAATPGSSARRC